MQASRNRKKRWLTLALVVAAAPILMAVVQWLSPRLPGTAGELFRRNLREDIEAAALIYSESGDIRDYLDPEKGRYRTGR